jgi:hypothetical protein
MLKSTVLGCAVLAFAAAFSLTSTTTSAAVSDVAGPSVVQGPSTFIPPSGGGTSATPPVVLDNMTLFEASTPGITVSSTSSAPNTFMGTGYNLAPGTNSITGFDVYPVNTSGTNFNALKINIYVWDTVNTSGTVNATTPAFSNLLAQYTLTSTGSFNTGFFYPFESASPGVVPGITLATPLLLTDNQIGLTYNYMGSTDGGATYANAQNLTSLIVAGTPAPNSVGAPLFSGYYRNANSETNGNFTSSLRTLGQANEQLAVRVYGTVVPEPSTLAMIGSILAACGLRRRSK